MRAAGFCDVCEKNVFLNDWVCQAGHDRSHISNWYDAETGESLVPPPGPPLIEPDAVAADPAGSMAGYLAQRLRDVGLNVAQSGAMLAVAVEDAYEACILVSSADHSITLWEQLSNGPDPGVREFVRNAGQQGWKVRVSLRPPELGE